ncbi:MAG: hypothetical protein GF334_04030 [Candidatus Altiarchaeales archaeon]|nr:hypothetical protein [Candidatus Altiarchaeales archaeon]
MREGVHRIGKGTFQRKSMRKRSGLSTEDPVYISMEEMSVDDLLILIRNMEEELGYFDDPPWRDKKKKE